MCEDPAPIEIGQPLLAANVLYVCVAAWGNVIYAFNASNGALRWQQESGCPYAVQLLLANGLLYAGNDILNPADGAIRGQLPFGAIAVASNGNLLYADSASPTQQTLYALAADGDALRWQYQVNLSALLVVAQGTVYVCDTTGGFPSNTPGLPDARALDATTGKVRWSYPSGPVVAVSVDDAVGLVYFTTESGPIDGEFGLDALDASSGRLRWQYQLGRRGLMTPVSSTNTLYFGADGVYALNALTGTIRWHVSPGGTSPYDWPTAVTLLNGTVYAWQNGTLYALSARDGSVLWHTSGLPYLPFSVPVAG